jgi:hypothetical protein
MISDGFVPLDQNGRPVPGLHLPRNPTWRSLANEWIVEYSRPDALRTFRLHCSLQPATGRMFVHASETMGRGGEPLRSNIQVLGLQLQNYTDGRKCEQESWEDGVIDNERTLKEMFSEFVLLPLWKNAEKQYDGTVIDASGQGHPANGDGASVAAADPLGRNTAEQGSTDDAGAARNGSPRAGLGVVPPQTPEMSDAAGDAANDGDAIDAHPAESKKALQVSCSGPDAHGTATASLESSFNNGLAMLEGMWQHGASKMGLKGKKKASLAVAVGAGALAALTAIIVVRSRRSSGKA